MLEAWMGQVWDKKKGEWGQMWAGESLEKKPEKRGAPFYLSAISEISLVQQVRIILHDIRIKGIGHL